MREVTGSSPVWSTMKNIYLVRHGETDANVHEQIPSHQEPLNATGFAQAAALAVRTKHLSFDTLISSDFKRAHQTATAIAELKGLPIQANALFREMMEPSSLYGVSEHDERVVHYRNVRNEHIHDPSWKQEDGDSWVETLERTRAALAFLEQEPAESILVASHALFLRLCAATMLLDPGEPSLEWFHTAKTLTMNNAGISLCTVTEGKWKIKTWNDHAHFAA